MALVSGTAYWASITTPNTRFDPVYSIDLVVDEKLQMVLGLGDMWLKTRSMALPL